MDKNRINVEIYGTKTLGLVDSGASLSCISDYLLNKLNDKQIRLNNSEIPNIFGVGGEKHQVMGKVSLPLSFKGVIVEYMFTVVQNLPHPLILGDDFLRDNRANIHYLLALYICMRAQFKWL